LAVSSTKREILPYSNKDGVVPFVPHPLLLEEESNCHMVSENAHRKQNVTAHINQ
jgi:hypothetical protein